MWDQGSESSKPLKKRYQMVGNEFVEEISKIEEQLMIRNSRFGDLRV